MRLKHRRGHAAWVVVHQAQQLAAGVVPDIRRRLAMRPRQRLQAGHCVDDTVAGCHTRTIRIELLDSAPPQCGSVSILLRPTF